MSKQLRSEIKSLKVEKQSVVEEIDRLRCIERDEIARQAGNESNYRETDDRLKELRMKSVELKRSIILFEGKVKTNQPKWKNKSDGYTLPKVN